MGLLAFSLFSMYSVKRSWRYGPFLTTAVGACMILTDMCVYDLNVLNYVGNAMIIGSAFWNGRLNRFRFAPKRT